LRRSLPSSGHPQNFLVPDTEEPSSRSTFPKLAGGRREDLQMYKLIIAAGFGLIAAMPAAAQSEQCLGECAEGFQWAQENDVTNPRACPDRSAEFARGCELYLDTATGDGGDDDD
jgi:hypothetical protein